jgi:tetratricopeptide (TPR) repeat protein
MSSGIFMRNYVACFAILMTITMVAITGCLESKTARFNEDAPHNATVDSLAPNFNESATYNFIKDIGNAKSVEIIKVHFKNSFRGIYDNIATVDRVWQISDTNSSLVIENSSDRLILKSGEPLKLREGYELAIKSIDIDDLTVNLELSKNGNVIDSKRIIIPQKTDDLYVYSTNIGSAEDVEVIKVHFTNAFRGAYLNYGTIDWIWQVSELDPSKVIINNSHEVTLNSGESLKLEDGYELAIQGLDINENKTYVGLYMRGREVDHAVLILPALILHNEGLALHSQGKYDEAIQAYEKAIKIDPRHAAAWNDKGLALYSQEKYDEAIKCFDEAIRLDPTTTKDIAIDAWDNKGDAFDAQTRYDEAITCYNRAREIDWMQKRGNTVFYKGNKHYGNGEYVVAIKYYDAVIKQDPKDKYALYKKADALRMLHRNSEAEAAYAKARELGYSEPMTMMEMTAK